MPIFLRIFHSLLWSTQSVFGIVNKEEVDIFLEMSGFFDDPTDVGSLISFSSAFSKPRFNFWKFKVHVISKPCWRILSVSLLVCEMNAIMR